MSTERQKIRDFIIIGAVFIPFGLWVLIGTDFFRLNGGVFFLGVGWAGFIITCLRLIQVIGEEIKTANRKEKK